LVATDLRRNTRSALGASRVLSADPAARWRISAEACVADILAGLERDPAILVVPGRARLGWWLYRALPGPMIDVVGARIARRLLMAK
jgi:hypothetical protein